MKDSKPKKAERINQQGRKGEDRKGGKRERERERDPQQEKRVPKKRRGGGNRVVFK